MARCRLPLPSLLCLAIQCALLVSTGECRSLASAHVKQYAFVTLPSASSSFYKNIRQLRGGAATRVPTPAPKVDSHSPSSIEASTQSSQDKISPLEYSESNTDAGSLSIQDLFDKLMSSPEGLPEEEAQVRLKQFGRNVLEQSPSKSVWQLILEQFEDRLVQILLAVALLSGIFSLLEVREQVGDVALWRSFVEPMVILSILILNAAVGVWQSQSASDSLEALQKLQPTLATVIREGLAVGEVDASVLVPGDVLEIRVGDKIPADSRLLSLKSSSLKVDEGSLTGESVTVGKLPGDEGRVDPDSPVQDQAGMLYSGTMITSGSGVAVVVQTGMDTQFGKVST